MAAATMAFMLGHGVVLLCYTTYSQPPESLLKLVEGCLMLALGLGFFVAIETVVFFPVGWGMAVLPVYGLFRWLGKSRYSGIWAVAFGAFLGMAFLPVCAGFNVWAFNEPDDPDFLTRCGEFAIAMIAAGAFGGYVFWRSVIAGKSWWPVLVFLYYPGAFTSDRR